MTLAKFALYLLMIVGVMAFLWAIAVWPEVRAREDEDE